jgi:hypothetical protein
LLVGAALFAAPAIATAQTAPAPSASAHPSGWHGHRPMMGLKPGMGSAFALRGAYGAIGHAEAAGGSGPYLEAAKAHYRDALTRNGKSDTRGAMAEARAASSLARASMALVAPPVPHDIPTPPAIPAGGGMMGAADRPEGPPMDGGPHPMMGGRGGPGAPDGWGGPGERGGMHGHRGGGEGLENLAKLAALANTDEAKRFANDALNANLAAERAAFAGNREEAMRERRLAGDLAGAVRALASLNMKPHQRTGTAAPEK